MERRVSLIFAQAWVRCSMQGLSLWWGAQTKPKWNRIEWWEKDTSWRRRKKMEHGSNEVEWESFLTPNTCQSSLSLAHLAFCWIWDVGRLTYKWEKRIVSIIHTSSKMMMRAGVAIPKGSGGQWWGNQCLKSFFLPCFHRNMLFTHIFVFLLHFLGAWPHVQRGTWKSVWKTLSSKLHCGCTYKILVFVLFCFYFCFFGFFYYTYISEVAPMCLYICTS